MIRVLIADDQALVRAGFRMILEAQPDMEVVGEAERREQAVAGRRPATRRRPDGHPHARAGRASRRRAGSWPTTRPPRVLVLTTFDLDEYVYDALRAGASGFLLKDVPPEQLADAVRSSPRGDALLAPAVTRRLIEEFVAAHRRRRPRPRRLDELTDRELEVLRAARARALQRGDRRAAVRRRERP